MSEDRNRVGVRLRAITAELHHWSAHVNPVAVDHLRAAVLTANRIFVAGAGKSGLAVRAFANRLTYDAVVAELKDELDQSVEQMRYRHANLE